MPRNIGSIEISVDADTGKLKAQLVRDGTAAGRAAKSAIERELANLEASIDLDRAQVSKDARSLRALIEASIRGIEIMPGLDTKSVIASLNELEAEVEALDLAINVHITDKDLAEINGHLRKLDSEKVEATVQFEADMAAINIEIEKFIHTRREAEIQFEADLTQINLNLDRFRAQQELNAINLRLETDLAGINAGIEAFRREQEARRVNVNMNPDIEGANARIEAWRRKQEADAIEIPIKADESSLGLLESRMGKIVGAILAMGEPLAQALQGGLAAATSVLSSGLSAVGAAAGAATPLMISFGAAIGSVVIGSQGVGDAMKAVTEEFKNAAKEGRAVNLSTGEVAAALRELSPSARATVEAFADISTELDRLQMDVQEELFSGFNEVVKELADDALPDMAKAMGITARETNQFGKDLADIANDTDWSGLAEGLAPALDAAFDAAAALVDTLEPFLRAATPAATRLAEMLERGADALRDWVTSTEGAEGIASFLDEGLTSLEQWGSLLQSTGDLLATVFDAGEASGGGFVTSLDRVIERWDLFLESTKGQDSLATFFQAGQDAISALVPVVQGLGEAFDVIITPESMGRFEELADAIGRALPVVGELISLLGQLGLAEAFANIVAMLQPVFDLLSQIPGPLLEIAGTAIVVGAGMMKIVGALKAVGIASKSLTLMNPVLLALAAAVTAAVVAYDVFTTKNREAEARTREFTNTLADTTDALIASGDAASSASVGVEAFNTALGEGDAGEALQKALGGTKTSIEDARDVLISFATDGKGALTSLAENYGLTADEAKLMAEVVDSTDDNFDGGSAAMAPYIGRLKEVAESSGFTVDQIVALAGSMEEVQDQSENTDLQKSARDYLELASGGSAAEQAMLDLAIANSGVALTAEDIIPLYDEYTKLVDENARAVEKAAEAGGDQASSYELVSQAIQDAIADHRAQEEALQAEREAAMDAYQAQLRLASATEAAAVAIADSEFGLGGAAQGLVDIGDAAREAADASDALTSALDILFGRAMSSQEAFDSFYASINDLNEQLAVTGDDALPKVGSGLEAVFGTTEAALGFRDAMRSGVEEIFGYAEAAAAAGTPAAEMDAQIAAMRLTLIATGTQFGLSTGEVDEFVTSLMGTPELVSTIVQTPGLIDALLNAENLTLLYDDAGNPVITEFEALGLDPALADTQEFKTLVDGLNGLTSDTTIESTTVAPTQEQTDALTDSVETLDGVTADPTLTVSTAPAVQASLDKINTTLTTLNTKRVTPSISMPTLAGVQAKVDDLADSITGLPDGSSNITVTGVQQGINKVNELDRAIEGLSNKTVTVRVNNITSNSTVGGDMTGRIVTSDQFTRVGERGLHEAIVPLQLPLSRVDPSVREMAALIRGEGQGRPTALGAGKVVNNYMTITPRSADPRAVATQIINRSAALANR